MAIKVPDNLMARPLLPGGGSDGTELVTRTFGNQEARASSLPSAPAGWGGVANPNAGAGGDAMARAADTIKKSALDAVSYYDDLRTAEEDSRSKVMFLEIDKKDAEVRTRLDADPEYARKGTAEQQQIYEIERDTAIDGIHQQYGFTQRAIVKHVQDGLAAYRATSSANYLEHYVRPRVVEQSKLNDAKSDNLVLDTVTLDPTEGNVQRAAADITERYSSPRAYATYGAHGASVLQAAAIGKLQATTLIGFYEKLGTSALANIPGGIIDTANFKDGPVGALVGDQLGHLNTLIDKLPITEKERMVLGNKGEKYILDFATKSMKDHNTEVKEADKLRLEHVQDSLDTWSVKYGIDARNGKLNQKAAFQAFNTLINDPNIKSDPQAIKKAYFAYDRVDSEIVGFQREQRRLASESKTRESIASLRMDNGIAVSGAALDGVWKKNGMLKSFFDGGNVVSQAHLQDIDKAGAVATSVLGSIQSDLRSQDPNEQKRGISNLMTIKTYSAKTQQALYKELPENFAGVINRLENGQTPTEALGFLTRPTNTPDVEKKLRQAADDKKPGEAADGAMKVAGFDPTKMSSAMHDEGMLQWQDAFSRANGDTKLAVDLFRQDLSKNRTWGVSDFSGKVEKWPTKNYAPKDVVTTLINQDYPKTIGKELLPVFSGFKTTSDGKQTPTYDVYVKEDGLLTRVNDNAKPFYMTPQAVAVVADKKRDDEINKGVASSLEVKDNQRYWEQKAAATKAAARNKQPTVDTALEAARAKEAAAKQAARQAEEDAAITKTLRSIGVSEKYWK